MPPAAISIPCASFWGEVRGAVSTSVRTGAYADLIKETGRDPIGLDLSGDQLRHAGPRYGHRVVLGDAQRLPFADASFETVLAAWISTDVDDFGQVLREIARVLVPGGALISYGVHPCFNGPHVENVESTRIIHSTYRRSGSTPPRPGG